MAEAGQMPLRTLHKKVKRMAAKKPKVKIYSTQSCPYCVMAKDYFKQKGIMYEEVDVSEDQEALQEMIKISGETGVPQIIIGKRLILGFDVKAIEKALAEEAK
jgi:glutaredoxin-like YruB-family protein